LTAALRFARKHGRFAKAVANAELLDAMKAITAAGRQK